MVQDVAILKLFCCGNNSVDLGQLLSEAVPQQPHHGRNGPNGGRRCERRAAARSHAESVEASESAEQADLSTDAINITEQVLEDEQNKTIEGENAKAPTTVTEEVTDEFCSNKEYDDGSKDDKIPNESETVI